MNTLPVVSKSFVGGLVMVRISCALVVVCAFSVSDLTAQDNDEKWPRRVPIADESLSYQPTATKEDLAAHIKAIDESTDRYRAIHGEIRAHWQVIRKGDEYEFDMDPKCAQTMIDELWRDWGYKDANYFYQLRVLGSLSGMARMASSAHRSDIQAILRDGYVEYYHGGGLRSDSAKMFLSHGIEYSGGLEYPAIRKIVKELGDPEHILDDGMATDTGDMPLDEDPMNQHKQALAEDVPDPVDTLLSEAERNSVAPSLLQDDTGAESGGSSDARKAARGLIRELRQLMRAGAGDAKELEHIAARAARGFGDARIDEEVLRSLLVAYRQILQRKHRPASKKIVAAIERDLVRIGRAKPCSAHTQFLWARAVAAMEQRASSALKDVLRELVKAEKKKNVSAALQYAAEKVGLSEMP